MLKEKINHEDYESATMDGKEGIFYGNYFFPLADGENTKVRALFGSEVRISQCPAFCVNKKRYLTATVMKNKECLRKNCSKMIRTPYSEEFWKERDEKIASKKAKKLAQRQYLARFSDK